MEVHSHTHSSARAAFGGKGKKWTHYLWEFLMLFLAVFCGFLAENIREHSVEKHREKEFMKSLLVDLQRDSIFLASNLKRGPHIVNYGDSLSAELEIRPLQGHEKRLYRFLSLVSEGLNFRYYDRTISQLRNSGGFRLISKPEVSDALLDYDVQMREAQDFSKGIESFAFISPVLQKSAAIFEIGLALQIFGDVRKYIHTPDSIHFPQVMKLITYDDATIKEFNSLQHYAQLTDIEKLEYSVRALEKNRQLDSLVRKAYHLH